MTLFTDNPLEKDDGTKTAGGVTMRRPFPIPRRALCAAVLRRSSPCVGLLSETGTGEERHTAPER